MHLRNGEPFLRRSVPNTGDEFMFLLFMGGFTTVLMKHDNHFYLLILIVETRWSHSMEQSYFQLQFIHFSICRELQLDILSCAKRVRQRLTYQEKSTNTCKGFNEN